MKIILNIALLGALMLLSLNSCSAQKAAKETKTIEFEVTGVCGMCKTRIENGALIKGVKQVSYDNPSGKLKVTYRADKVSEEDIHKAVAEVGHDTKKVKATEEAYKKLPGCCAYRDGAEKH